MLKKHTQLLLVVAAFVISAVCVALISSPPVVAAMAGAFLMVVGAYTSLDLYAVVRATSTLPSGAYVSADKWKYFVGILLLALLMGFCIVKEQIYNIDLNLAYGVLGPGIVTILGCIVAGIKANKVATLNGPAMARKTSGD